MNMTLAAKQVLDGLITGGVEPYYLSYNPNLPGTATLEADAVAAGYTMHAREASANLVEVIYTKA